MNEDSKPTFNIGEFRAWLALEEGREAVRTTHEVYEELAASDAPLEIKAYAVVEGLRLGVIALTFGFAWNWPLDTPPIVTLNTLPDWPASILRPFITKLGPQGMVGPREPTIDLLPWLPVAPPKLPGFHLHHDIRRTEHFDTYFDHFADEIDRRSLLPRTNR